MATNYNFDLAYNRSSLSLLVDGTFVTSYVFLEGRVTLSARPTMTAIGLENLRSNVADIVVWQGFLLEHLIIPATIEPPYALRIESTSDTVFFLLEIDRDEVIRAAYLRTTDVAEFAPRSERILSWRGFVRFVETLTLFIEEIERQTHAKA